MSQSKVVMLWASEYAPTASQLMELNDKYHPIMTEVILLKDIDMAFLMEMVLSPDKRYELYELVMRLMRICGAHNVDYIINPGGSPALQAVLGKVVSEYATAPDVMYSYKERGEHKGFTII